MPDKTKIRIASIGLGDIAQKAYLPILATHSRIDPVLCTRNVQTLNELARRFRIDAVYSDLEELIQTRPDAAMVHSTTASHPEIVLKLLEARIPVFVDKPLSYSLEESERMLDLALKYDLPFFVGFNRRFAPLVAGLSEAAKPIQVSWQKNRGQLPGVPREFVYDDFIHVIDGLLFLGAGEVKELTVVPRIRHDKLESIAVQWVQGETLLVGSMNRVSGKTEEIIEYYTPGNKWVVKELNYGTHYSVEGEVPLKFSNWDSTLYKRGFEDMIEKWLAVLEEGKCDPEAIEEIRRTHRLCENILDRVITAGAK